MPENVIQTCWRILHILSRLVCAINKSHGNFNEFHQGMKFARMRRYRHPREICQMRMTLLIATAAALIGGPSLARADLIGVTSITGGSNFASYNNTFQTIGFAFSSGTAISVTALGFYDQSPTTPLSQSHQIGLWDSSGTLLTSVTVDPTDPLTDSFRYHAVTPLELVASATYRIGAAVTSPFTDFYYVPGSLTTSPDITLLDSARNASSGGFSDPSTVTTGNGRFGPNLQYVEGTVDAPEPVSLALLSSGLFGLGLVRRRAA